MDTLSIFPRADGVSIQKNLGTSFFWTIVCYRQALGRLRETVWLALPSTDRLIEGKQITPGGVSLLSSSNLKGGVNDCDVRLPRRDPFH